MHVCFSCGLTDYSRNSHPPGTQEKTGTEAVGEELLKVQMWAQAWWDRQGLLPRV